MSLGDKVSAFNRNRKWEIFLREIQPSYTMKMLDVGFNAIEYSDVDNYIEKHYPYPEQLTALGVDSPGAFRTKYPKVTAVQYDGGVFPFEDNQFDACWSNAVIEHVGNRTKQLNFLREIKRVANRAFITTPNRMFPIEVHTRTPFLHWLPKPIFDKYLTLIGKQWAAGNYMHLLTIGQLSQLMFEAEIKKFKIFENKLAGFTIDFVVVF